jgi:hypothetical protein
VFEWIEDTGECSAHDVLDQMRVDDDLVQCAAGAPACVDINRTEVGDDFAEEFVGERRGVFGTLRAISREAMRPR